MFFLKKFIIYIVSLTNYIILKKKSLVKIKDNSQKYINISNIIKLFKLKHVNTIFQYSKSQIGQDVFVATASKFKKNGYFIEIGSADGLYNSNTYLLEKKYNWRGLLIEPNVNWFNKKISRNKSLTINSAIYKKIGTVGFDFKKNFYESKIN
jgi:hypothetical protein